MPTPKVRALALAALLLAACGGAEEPSPSRIAIGAECPAGASWDGSRCAPRKALVAAAPETCPDGRAPDRGECPPARDVDEPRAGFDERPPLHAVRDPRPRVHKPRSASLLRVEIQQLKALLELTSKESPERPRILRRLAENYTELAWAAPRESESARTYASQYYTTLVKEHKTHCAAPPEKGCADEALYYLGLELEILGNYDMARKNYFMLIRDFPRSTFVPYAYFAFGELFFSEGMKGDPSKLPLAEQAYEKVTQFPDSPVAPEALLRLAQIADAAGDAAKAERYRTRASTMMPAYAPAPPSPAPR